MTDRAPIPPEAFADAVDRLDRDALAAFVGRIEAAANDATDVAVDPPVVTVDDGGDETQLLVVADPDTDATPLEGVDVSADAVVVGSAASPTPAADVPVRTPADLRRRLLYAASPEAADSIAETWLETPVRSASFASDPAPTGSDGDDSDTADAESGTPDGSPAPAATGSTTAAAATADRGDSQHTADAGGSDKPERRTAGTPEGRSAATDDSTGAVTRSGAGIVVAGVLAVVILAGAGGVVYAAEVAPGGDAGAFAASPTVEQGGLSYADIRRRSRGMLDGSSVVTTAATPDGDNGTGTRPVTDGTERIRNVRPAPNCERSFLNVVQIQMNALRYNNATTDDGIRTVRRFSSPRNRRAIETFDEFAAVIKGPTYSPMLSHDSAQFTPIQSSDDFAQVQVVTREDGNVTGKYYFRLGKVETGEYDGCWMTDAVVSVPETTNFSGEVAGRSTGSGNDTA